MPVHTPWIGQDTLPSFAYSENYNDTPRTTSFNNICSSYTLNRSTNYHIAKHIRHTLYAL